MVKNLVLLLLLIVESDSICPTLPIVYEFYCEDDTSCTLKWKPPCHPDSSVHQYQIQHTTSCSTPFITSFTPGEETQSTSLTCSDSACYARVKAIYHSGQESNYSPCISSSRQPDRKCKCVQLEGKEVCIPITGVCINTEMTTSGSSEALPLFILNGKWMEQLSIGTKYCFAAMANESFLFIEYCHTVENPLSTSCSNSHILSCNGEGVVLTIATEQVGVPLSDQLTADQCMCNSSLQQSAALKVRAATEEITLFFIISTIIMALYFGT